jgi:hypothetical protein
MDFMENYAVAVLDKYIVGEVIIPNTKPLPKTANNSSQVYVYALNIADKIIKTYKFCGEEFEIYLEDNNIILSHPTWSLSGMGKSLIDAEKNLLQESKIVLEHYIDVPESKLSEDAIELKNFLLHNVAAR